MHEVGVPVGPGVIVTVAGTVGVTVAVIGESTNATVFTVESVQPTGVLTVTACELGSRS